MWGKLLKEPAHIQSQVPCCTACQSVPVKHLIHNPGNSLLLPVLCDTREQERFAEGYLLYSTQKGHQSGLRAGKQSRRGAPIWSCAGKPLVVYLCDYLIFHWSIKMQSCHNETQFKRSSTTLGRFKHWEILYKESTESEHGEGWWVPWAPLVPDSPAAIFSQRALSSPRAFQRAFLDLDSHKAQNPRQNPDRNLLPQSNWKDLPKASSQELFNSPSFWVSFSFF